MIIDKITKGFQTRSDKPNENWTNQDIYYVVDDNSELAQKIQSNFPNFEFVIEDGRLIDIEIIIPKPTHEEINAMVVNKIREKYDINEEFKMINLGILNPENEEYQAYRTYVAKCIAWGDSL